MDNRRQVNIECLRILCIFMITLFHYVFHGNLTEATAFNNRLLIDVLYHFGEIGVDCFILISGYFLTKSIFKPRKVFLLIIEMEFYIILSKIILSAALKVPVKWSIRDFFPIIDNEYWFVHVYLLIYLLTPILKKTVHVLTKKEISLFLLFQISIWSVFPTVVLGVIIGDNNIESMTLYNRYVWLTAVYLAGYYIGEYGLPFRLSKVNHLITMVLLIISLLAYIIMCECGVLKRFPLMFWPPNSILVFMLSVFLFYAFLRWKPHYSGKLILITARCSLGVYLFQDGFLRDFLWNGLFAVPYQSLPLLRLFCQVFLAAVYVFFTGVIIDLLRQLGEKWIVIPIIDKLYGETP